MCFFLFLSLLLSCVLAPASSPSLGTRVRGIAVRNALFVSLARPYSLISPHLLSWTTLPSHNRSLSYSTRDGSECVGVAAGAVCASVTVLSTLHRYHTFIIDHPKNCVYDAAQRTCSKVLDGTKISINTAVPEYTSELKIHFRGLGFKTGGRTWTQRT